MKKLTPPPLFRYMVGPSFIILGLGLGSGEIILWPKLVSLYGLGIIWAAVLGLSLQYILNTEIERYTLITGESVFAGFSRQSRRAYPWWFIISTLLPWMWPGVILSSATLIAFVFGFSQPTLLGIILISLTFGLYSFSSQIYRLQENFQKTIILIGIPIVFTLALIQTDPSTWQQLGQGLLGIGQGYLLLPSGLAIATFLSALVFAGAGGNLNLAQSFYIREKNYGATSGMGPMPNVWDKKKKPYRLFSKFFPLTSHNLVIYKQWLRLAFKEHRLVFWATGLVGILALALLAAAQKHQLGQLGGIDFLLAKGVDLGYRYGAYVGTLFLFTLALMLLGTHFAVMGSTGRIVAENCSLLFGSRLYNRYFGTYLLCQSLLQVLILSLGFNEPLLLITLSAVFNAVTMAVYTLALLSLNLRHLPLPLRPPIWRRLILVVSSLIYGGFTLLTLWQSLI